MCEMKDKNCMDRPDRPGRGVESISFLALDRVGFYIFSTKYQRTLKQLTETTVKRVRITDSYSSVVLLVSTKNGDFW